MKKIFTRIFTAVMVAMLFGLASCKKLSSFDYPPTEGTPYQIISDDATYASFKLAIDRAGLQDMFNGETEYTYFLPTSDALSASGLAVAYLQNMPTAEAATLVKNHIVAGKVDPKAATTPLKSLSGRDINISKQGAAYYADANDITSSNIVVKGGLLNVVNGVLLTQNSLLDIVKNYQHITTTLRIDMTLAAITRASTGSANFNNLLSGTDNYTFFAPTNQAWISWGYAAVANINAAPVETLVGILKNHLVAGSKLTTTLDSTGVATNAGGNIYFNKYRNFRTTEVYANGIMLSNGGANIVAKNGVMHVIPWVLRAPVAKNTLEQLQGDANLSTFYAAVVRASTADPVFNFQNILSGTSPFTLFAVNNAGMTAAGYPNVAAVNAAAPADLAKLVKLHILNRRVHWISASTLGVNSLLVTKNSTGADVQNPLTFGAYTIVANGAGTFAIKAPGNATPLTATSANTTTTNGMFNIVNGVFIP